jgi:predicted secreted protein
MDNLANLFGKSKINTTKKKNNKVGPKAAKVINTTKNSRSARRTKAELQMMERKIREKKEQDEKRIKDALMLEKRRAAAKKAQETKKRIAAERAERKRMIEERKAREASAHINMRPSQNNNMEGPKNSLKKLIAANAAAEIKEDKEMAELNALFKKL